MDLHDAGFMIITTGKVRILNYFIALVFLFYLNATRNQVNTRISHLLSHAFLCVYYGSFSYRIVSDKMMLFAEWFFIPIYLGDLCLFCVYSISADYVCHLIVSFRNANQKQSGETNPYQ